MSERAARTCAILTRRRLLRRGAALPLLVLAGCQLPGSGPPPREFRVTPKTTFGELPHVDWSLVIDRPASDPSFDTTRIARTEGVEVQYYADASWVDRPPAMLEPMIIQSFRNSGAIEVVAGRRSDVRPDFMLQTTIAAFQAQPTGSGGPPEARVVLQASLMAMPRRRVVGTTEIARSVPAQAATLDAIAAAFDDALGKVLKRLVEWTLVTGQASRRTS